MAVRPGPAGAALAGCRDSRASAESHGAALRLRAGAATPAGVETQAEIGRIKSDAQLQCALAISFHDADAFRFLQRLPGPAAGSVREQQYSR